MLRIDAWASMVVDTVVTVAFYLLGAATLGRLGRRRDRVCRGSDASGACNASPHGYN